jgi:hypothetical protein
MKILFVDGAGVQRSFEADATLRESPKPIPLVCDLDVTNTPIVAPAGISESFAPVSIQRKFNALKQGAQISGGQGVRLQFSLAEIELGGSPVKITPAVYEEVVEPVGVQVLQFSQEFDRLREAFDLFDELRTNAVACTCVTSLRAFENMYVTRVSGSREPRDSMTFTVEWLQLRVVSVGLVEVVPVAEKRGEKKKAKGAQASYELDPEKESLAAAVGL